MAYAGAWCPVLQAACDPEHLLAQQRLAATALGLPVTLGSAWPPAYDDAALARLENAAFDTSTLHGVELAQVSDAAGGACGAGGTNTACICPLPPSHETCLLAPRGTNL